MTAKEFVLDYVLNHSDNRNDKGEPYYSNLEEFFEIVAMNMIGQKKPVVQDGGTTCL